MTDNVGTYGPYVRNTQRKSPRANFHDYSGGDYFVTICTRDKEHYFGQIVPADVGTHGSCVQEYDMKFTPTANIVTNSWIHYHHIILTP